MSFCNARLALSTYRISGARSGIGMGLDICKVTFQYLTGNLTLSGVAMNGQTIRAGVAGLFAGLFSGSRRCSTAVAIEQELFAMDLIGGHCVAPARVRDAIDGRDYARWVTFE